MVLTPHLKKTPSQPWPSLPHPNPTDKQISSQRTSSCSVLVFMPDCSSLKPPPHGRLPDQTIGAVQVLAPVTWGFASTNSPVTIPAAFTWPLLRVHTGSRRPAYAATVQLSARRAAKLHRHPLSATGSIIHCLQWRYSGSGVSERFYCGDSVPDYLERGITCFCRKVFATRTSIFSPVAPSGLVYSYHASKRSRNHECKSDSFVVFLTLEQHRCGFVVNSKLGLFWREGVSWRRSVVCAVNPAWICTREGK